MSKKKKKKPAKGPPKESTTRPVAAAWTSQEPRAFADSIEWRTEPTRWAFFFLTHDERQERTEGYVQEIAASVVRGWVRPVSSQQVNLGTGESKKSPISDETRISQTLMMLTATRLDNSFGGAAEHLIDKEDSWDANMAFTATLHVDWWQLADALLRRYVAEYVPSEVTHPFDQETEDSDDLDDEDDE